MFHVEIELGTGWEIDVIRLLVTSKDTLKLKEVLYHTKTHSEWADKILQRIVNIYANYGK